MRNDPEHSRIPTNEERVIALKLIAADRVVKNARREKTPVSLIFRAFNFNVSLRCKHIQNTHPCLMLNLDDFGCINFFTQHLLPRAELVYADCHCDA